MSFGSFRPKPKFHHALLHGLILAHRVYKRKFSINRW
jgi:hypothetical protein